LAQIFFSSPAKKFNKTFKFCDICGYKKKEGQQIVFSPFVAVFGSGLRDPGSEFILDPIIRDKHPVSATLDSKKSKSYLSRDLKLISWNLYDCVAGGPGDWEEAELGGDRGEGDD
jgi:hypothetical protein